MECVQSKIKAKGLDNVSISELEEFKCWTEIASNIAKYDYHYNIIEAMKKPENEYGVNYDENGKFYTPHRNAMGRFTRGYIHDPDIERYRDMDRPMGHMYYSDMDHMNSEYVAAKKGYEEQKILNPAVDNTAAMEKLIAAFEKDMAALKPKMTASEKATAKTKLANVVSTVLA